MAEAIFTCQTGECTDALGKNLEAWSGVSWWKKCSQKQFWRTIFKLSTHLLRASRLDRLDSYRYTHVLYPLRKSWILHTKIFWVCLWLRNTSNTSLTTWFISVFTIYRVLLLSTLWCRLIFELLFVSACRIRDRSQIKNFFHSSLAIFVPSNSYFGTMQGLRRLLALLAKGLDFFFMICTESFWLHFVSGSNNYRLKDNVTQALSWIIPSQAFLWDSF